MPEMKFDSPSLTTTAATSLRIIAAAIVFACLYFASSLVISLLCGVFIAFILEPGVRLMERSRIPRWVGALLMVLATLGVMYFLLYLIYGRAVAFMNDLPRYAVRLKEIIAHFQVTIHNIRLNASSLFPPAADTAATTVQVQQESSWLPAVWHGLNSVFGFVMAVLFIPILVFFMLTSKHHIWVGTMNLFPVEQRHSVEGILNGITDMVRQYVLGNLLVAAISAVVICPVFAVLGLPYALLLGLISAFLSMVPYLGVALGAIPPLLVAVVQPQYNDAFPFVVIALTIVIVHFVAMNILTPKLVGRRVNLNALAVTVGMMFWGWLWGAVGLVLAVPITAAIKAICDNVDGLKSYGALLGDD